MVSAVQDSATSEAWGESTEGLVVETYGQINIAGCDKMATTTVRQTNVLWAGPRFLHEFCHELINALIHELIN